MIKKVSLILSVSLLVSQAYSKTCYMLSGLEMDQEKGPLRVMHEAILKDGVPGDGTVCKVFDSLEALETEYNENLPPRTQRVVIIQGAHGNPGGACSLNGGPAEASELLGAVQNIARTHPTAYIVESCYSGDLLRDKIVLTSIIPKIHLSKTYAC